ncbi:MAG TPA: hypothetical protein VMK12_03865 [Anaeromyxobacteraceae bacterium]|nr:hypothetical protein [Anaeromyxobacteraceae bacterium]
MSTKGLAIAALCVVGGVGLGFWQGYVRTKAAADRKLEAAELKAGNQIVAAQASQGQLNKQIADLKAQLEAVSHIAPVEKIVYVDRVVTVPVAASGIPRPFAAQKPPATPSLPAPAGGPAIPEPVPATCPEQPPCLLAVGDTGEVRCTVSGVQTKAGNVVVVGTGEAWRLTPEPATAILPASPFRAETSTSSVSAPSVTRARWALSGGVSEPWGVWGGADLRLLGPLWIRADVGVEDGKVAVRGGARWEF